METITSNTKTLELTGEEIHVHFSSAFPYFWLRNDGTWTVQMSVSPNIEEGKDGVIEVLAGSSAGTMHGYNKTCNDLYILGSGKVQIMATYSPENPFRKAQKGGGESSILPHSDGLAAYFNYEQNVESSTWTDVVSNIPLLGNFTLSDNGVTIDTNINMPFLLTDPYTVYIVFKRSGILPLNSWYGVFTTEKNNFGIFENYGKIGVYADYTPNQYVSDIPTSDYHICALTFYNGYVSLYIDGDFVYTRRNSITTLATVPYYITAVGKYKALILYDNVAHGNKYVLENTRFLAEKYGIEI